ncbi:elongator complex protein 1 [Westerdykella ornata]|uniref:Elongator complex protein 1 n=1 Tax=Westerdykella ornata TaxID=318751 RepID=A0A6A6JQX0_WESOR|nr:elongator complex protein 1 [Westerdykella ornata]KAF2278096.1 elongator complex protein 1 [Westerdykella ornata]
MRNLKIVGRSLLRFTGEEPRPLTATAWDAASDALICAFGPTESRAVIELTRLHYDGNSSERKLEGIASWDAPCPLPSLPHDRIVDLHHFSDTSTTCLVLAGGDIILVREHRDHDQDLVEIVGSIDAGISAAAWSPDEELLAIVTAADTLLLMTRDIENITSVTLTADDVNVSNHVSVGWGKKETQFKGKRARALQDPTVPERIDEGVLSPFDDRSVTISWRGDGAFFAVSTIEQERRRMIRVYSREAELDSVSEPVDGLEGALSWRPSGNLMASLRRLSDRIDVVFFERNGLRHGQFDLRFTAEQLQELKSPLALRWNNDSTILAVSHPGKVQLWTMSNYHYYLKQELVFPQGSARNVMCGWHPERPLSVALATADSLHLLDYLSAPATGSVSPPHDYGAVATIDGMFLKLTPLRIANVPPPMSLLRLPLDACPVDVAVSKSSTRIAVVSVAGVAVYALDINKRPVPMPSLLWRSKIPSDHLPRQIAFLGDDKIFVLADRWEGDESFLWTNEAEDLIPCGPILESGRASSLVTSVDYQKVFIQFEDGALYNVGLIDDQEEPSAFSTTLVLKTPPSAPEVKVAIMDAELLAFSLSRSGVLCANDRILVRNCTSYVVTPSHLIFTTTQHLLKFVHLTAVNDLEIPLDEPQKDERCRSIERGARIVTVMPSTYTIVLQMPRGNLETIYPRALVLAAIRRSIDEDRYGDAFRTCRSQRVDMNILHDHDPDRFMTRIEEIVAQIGRVEHIDLLLSQLRNEDVTETMYKETLKRKDLGKKAPQPQAAVGSKVNRICDAFLAVLEKPQYREVHIQNIITAHVCKVPADLESGLEMIGRLQSLFPFPTPYPPWPHPPSPPNLEPETQDPVTEKAAEHICFLADVNQLYDTALGLYNLDLALLIAQQSQKDPREYLPQLQSLHDLPPLRRKFRIDDQLGRRQKALAHLKDLDAFEEVQDYVQKHGLYAEALQLYHYDSISTRVIMRHYADHLAIEDRHKEAAIAYDYLEDHSAAWPHYRSAHLWQEALSSAILAGVSEAQLLSLAASLAEDLAESKDYVSASTIQLSYLRDLPAAIKLLCRACQFAEATRLLTLHRDTTLFSSILDPALIERSGETTEFLAEMRSQLLAQVPRLRELRIKKAADPSAFFEGLDDSSNIPDNVSVAPTETTSGGTFMTRYTNRSSTVNTATTRRTSKKKRQEERKRARGKKGTVYEEEYLVNSIERLIDRVNGMGAAEGEVQRLIEGLVKRGMRERAEAISNAMADVVERCKAAVAELYEKNNETEKDEGQLLSNGEAVLAFHRDPEVERPPLSGADATLWASMAEVNRKRPPPIVKDFKRICLLG